MALSRKAKTWLIVLAIPIVLVVGGAVALKMLFTSERLKNFIVPKIEDATHRNVAVNSISLSIFPTLAVEVDGLSVSNKQGEGFSEKPMLQLDKLVLDVRLLALLKGNLEVSNVTLERPQVLLEVNEKGMANYAEEEAAQSLAGEAERNGPSGEPSTVVTNEVKSQGFGLLLSDLQIIDGALEYVDRKGNSTTTLDGMNHRVRVGAPAGSNEISIETQSTVEKVSYGSLTTPLVSNLRLALDQKILYNSQEDVVKLLPGTVSVQEIQLNMSGDVTECTKVPVLNLLIESDKVSIPELLSLIPKEYMTKAEGVKGNGVARVKIEVKGSATDSTYPDIAGLISATDATIHYAQLPEPITHVNIAMDFTRAQMKQEFRITRFSATLGDNPLGATATITNFDDPSLMMSLSLSMNLAEVKNYYPLEAGTEFGGSMKANVNIAGKVSNPSSMKASGTMDFQGVTIKMASSNNPVHNLNGSITFNNQRVEAKKITMTLGKSDLAMAFSMMNYLSMISNLPAGQADAKKIPKATANLSLTSNHLYTADVMGEDKPDAAAAKPQSTQPSVEQRQVGTIQSGSGRKAAQGKQVDAPQSGVPLPNVDMDIVATIGTLTMEKFELKNVKSSMKIANGIVMLQGFTCNVFDGSVATKGSLNMQKPDRSVFDLAFDMNGVDAHAMLPKFTSFGERLFGRLSMNTSIKGVLNDTLGFDNRGLNGQGRVNIQDGTLTGVKANKTIASLVKLPDLEAINFKDWTNSFAIADGRVIIKDLRIAALGGDYLVNGSQGLDGSMDYSMSMLLSDKASAQVSIPGFAGEAVQLFKEPGGRVKLDFTVGGTYDDPKVQLDTKPAQKKAEDLAKQKVNEEAKKLGEEARKKGGDVLKDLFKKKK